MIGIGNKQWRMVAAALTLGGNIRVGLEDNLYLPSGELARSNGDLVAEAVSLARTIGCEVASISEARETLQMPLVPG